MNAFILPDNALFNSMAKRALKIVSLLAPSLVLTSFAFAQSDGSDSSASLEEIVVVAQKREQKLKGFDYCRCRYFRF